jgi:xanthine dehydrogenase accessory factor
MVSHIEWLKQLSNFTAKGAPISLVTITEVKGSSPRDIGSKMFVGPEGRLWGTIGGGRLEELIINDAKEILKGNTPYKIQYPLSEKAGQCCGGVVEVLIEPLNTNPHLYIFGAGHVGTALANTMINTVFHIHVIDERPEWCLSPAIHQDVQRHSLSPLDFLNTITWEKSKKWAIVMTHDHTLDQKLVLNLSHHNLAYLGLIGSNTKWRRFRARLKKDGISDDLLDKVHCPAGINIGGETPQEIAISISAEIVESYYSLTKEISVRNTAMSSWISAESDPCEHS